MKERVLRYLFSPYVIALVLTILALLFVPNYFNKYTAELVDTHYVSRGTYQFYIDLNNDGESESIIHQVNNLGNASYVLHKSNGDQVDQFNLDHPFADGLRSIWFQDSDNDKFNEIYIITQKDDSLFLNIHEPFVDGSLLKNIFIDTIRPHSRSFQARIGAGSNAVSHFYNRSEIIFSVKSGFSGYPRNIYRFDPETKNIIRSPHLVNHSVIQDVIDLNADGKNEIILVGNASANTLDTTITDRSDYSTWINVLNEDLEFQFDPIELKALGSVLLFTITSDDSSRILGLFSSKEQDKRKSELFYLDPNGNFSLRKEIDGKHFSTLKLDDDSNINAISWQQGERYVFDRDFNFVRKDELKTRYNTGAHLEDVNNDGQNDWIVSIQGNNRVAVYDDNLSETVELTLENEGGPPPHFGLRKIDSNTTHLIVQADNKVLSFTYGKNPMYFFKYGFYLIVYLTFLGLVALIARSQRHRLEQKQKLESEISTLQIRAIKNQVDPHFVFNAINTISEMTLMDNKLEADRFISRFSDFMRGTLKSSDKIITTLNEELAYTENFIQLQQIRFGGKFSYRINLTDGINPNYLIPKHALFCYVENAIKHGISLKKDGLLEISISKKENKLRMTVSDNGGGLNGSAAPEKHSTGSGLSIMDQIFGLYSKLNKQKISKKVTELIGENGKVKGVEVSVSIDNPVIRAHEN